MLFSSSLSAVSVGSSAYLRLLIFLTAILTPACASSSPVELFQILKDDAVKVPHSCMPANLENSAVVTGLEKVSFYSNPKERQC